MALAITIIITLLLGTIVILIYGKANIKRIIAPLLILLISDFLFLYAKFVVGDSFLTLLLYLSAIALLIISMVWFVIIFIFAIRKKDSKKKILAISLSIMVSVIILIIPALQQEDKFKLYQNDFFTISEAVFQAYDEGELAIGNRIQSRDLEKPDSIFSNQVINKMKKLNRLAGVYTYIVADQDVIYFSYGAVFQSIRGIAITRNDKDPSTDESLKSRFFDGNTSYTYIIDDAYHFYDGL